MEDDELDEMHEIVEGVELLSDGELEELGKAEVNIMNIDDEVSTDSVNVSFAFLIECLNGCQFRIMTRQRWCTRMLFMDILFQ